MDPLTLTIVLYLFKSLTQYHISKLSSTPFLLLSISLFVLYTVNLLVVWPRSCRVIFYFDTLALGRRHQIFWSCQLTCFLFTNPVVELFDHIISHIININFRVKHISCLSLSRNILQPIDNSIVNLPNVSQISIEIEICVSFRCTLKPLFFNFNPRNLSSWSWHKYAFNNANSLPLGIPRQQFQVNFGK